MSEYWAEKESRVKDLDAIQAHDLEYRKLLATGSKASLKRNETWRSRVMRYVDNDKKRDSLPQQINNFVKRYLNERITY